MNDIITLRGFVASEVKSSTTIRGTSTASFRLGTTERRYDRANNVWVDGNTNWYTIQSFRYLAGHVGCSIKKGQRVIVVGRLRLRQWEHEGKIYHVAEVDAESVGHDLMWGSANFTRMNGSSGQADAAGSAANGSGEPETEVPGEELPPVAGRPGSQTHGTDWESPDDRQAPPEDGAADAEELGEQPGGVLVNTQTGELVDATA
ncbi:single-stranded DNA-binding protein [Paenarthrobacter sp. NPDC089675]|uniref:single-stranded DNA-binding protein n=1 Tax=Paenarthrobacter sp. NPDC089675 TaxID=3364376 RepID=UPI00381224E7